MSRHPLHAQITWIRKNWPKAEIVNNVPDGHLVITLCLNEKGGQGRTFLQSQINDCMAYIKDRSNKDQLELDL